MQNVIVKRAGYCKLIRGSTTEYTSLSPHLALRCSYENKFYWGLWQCAHWRDTISDTRYESDMDREDTYKVYWSDKARAHWYDSNTIVTYIGVSLEETRSAGRLRYVSRSTPGSLTMTGADRSGRAV
jgi:hypothetical protein